MCAPNRRLRRRRLRGLMAGMANLFTVIDIGSAIQQAVAPVFLLTAIGGILNVLAHRLSRVVDRARHLEGEVGSYPADRRRIAIDDLSVLARRMAAANWAIALCTLAALLVCLVVVLLFMEQLVKNQLDEAIAWVFIAATLMLTGGLLLFLWEIQLALRSVRVRAADILAERR
ncbi:hypothetical protein CHU93_04365 [Sandarakinorhabdus cyanobacteriorum]|uniref:DUF2721 domain-containing protein n=2 Tax=Sandarakinorhabdus cyanobacteriorum TaxID=1981098 RepID=A0A255YPZ2_9SPHN|nr:hypothetical protein CHU93_04365 [Sandarakinorhabdus cyanobacteriorum]